MGRRPSSTLRSKSLDLQKDRLSAPYRERLDVAGERLTRWCQRNGRPLEDLVLEPPALLSALVRYLQILFDEGAAYWWALHAVLFLQTRYRQLRGHLTVAWDSIGTWRMHLPVQSRVPLRVELVCALSYAAVLHGCCLDVPRCGLWLRFAAVLRLGFFALLRPKEIYRLLVGDVMVPRLGTHSLLQCVVATIREPKNRAPGGRIQVRMLREPAAVRWITWLLQDARESELVWPHGPEGFGRALKKLLAFTGLGSLGITPSSLRAGGAAALLEQGASVSHILFAGGWTSEKTLSSYLQVAEAAQTLLKLDYPQALWLHSFVQNFAFLEEPPAAPYEVLSQPWTRAISRPFSLRPPSSS